MVMQEDRFELERFVKAQEPIYVSALAELRAGRKRSHWMWFIFPQVIGLGGSAMAQRYAISGLDEARAYLAHPVLGKRLLECVGATMLHGEQSAVSILGHVDAMKLRSSLTLFAQISEPNSPFHRALEQFYQGKPDHATSEILSRRS